MDTKKWIPNFFDMLFMKNGSPSVSFFVLSFVYGGGHFNINTVNNGMDGAMVTVAFCMYMPMI
jgi:hypothetical protein